MKIYIAGKVTGEANYKTKFYQAGKAVEHYGHTALLPSILPSTGLTEADYMRICLAMIESSDLVLFLPDYTKSEGAIVEWLWCQKTGKPWDFLAAWLNRQEDDET